jgi:hypothetical protein
MCFGLGIHPTVRTILLSKIVNRHYKAALVLNLHCNFSFHVIYIILHENKKKLPLNLA